MKADHDLRIVWCEGNAGRMLMTWDGRCRGSFGGGIGSGVRS
jgi:hypothetical protein